MESEHPQKLACRFELRGTVADYCRVAAGHLAAGGVFACVFPVAPAEQEARIHAGALGGGPDLGALAAGILREGDRPLLGLFLMQRAGDLPEALRDRPGGTPADHPHRCRGGPPGISGGETGLWVPAVKRPRKVFPYAIKDMSPCSIGFVPIVAGVQLA